MDGARVALLKCESYNVDTIEEKLRYGFELLGGEEYLRNIIPPGSTVLLKPNLLSAELPNTAVVTHPAVFEAVIRIIKDYCGKIKYGDSPGFGKSLYAAQKAGLVDIGKKYGAEFDSFEESIHYQYNEALLCKSWTVAKAAFEADVLISLPKLKTHAMAYYTGAIKNQFGCVPGTLKATWHTRMPQSDNFSRMLLDLNKVVNTSFAILDGIMAMEGNGPRNGTPRQMNTLVMGDSITAVDTVGARLIGYKPEDIPMLRVAKETNWGPVDNIMVLGQTIEDMECLDFKKCRSKMSGNFHFQNKFTNTLLGSVISPSPNLIKNKCIKCGRCSQVCPEKPAAISMDSGYPSWDMSRCIRCFCCQELCPEGAINLKYSKIGRILRLNKR